MTQTVLLAIDTSTEFCSVALLCSAGNTSGSSAPDAQDALRIWTRHEATGAVSSTRLLPAVRELFDEAGFGLTDCDAIAFGAGPGSFTGLRTATGVAQGLAFGLGVPVVPVSTLVACAEAARLADPSATRVLAALDARMDEVYWADFAWDDAQQEWRTIQSASLDAPAQLVIPDEPFTLAGNAAAAFGERLPAAAHAQHVNGEAVPHARAVAVTALRALRAGRTVRPDQAAPEYVRNKVAQTVAERLAAKATTHAGTLASRETHGSPEGAQ
ncbi:tRNA (adenosine(37)-N6)-threonylcarbamoyltransferase complex dimerization subunit type 1 TsaB [Paraburkholderia kururiensis]|uniref:tRNA (Adenosine(37)-N6)-threonylcarbamoyltransferase complex dimerization subunit type 1 TsaB n=1 Tax=Paraburkholderia kururiensis TaxID=984307 RepID=A0ABZ0WR21_9BURK|nr:tRNA (adenosine(37)-N6)-threonylcarbamoyltransferase complex dimerization subunit type 1 TsaB [Paraburkholderia kururiensis]WQD79802.1 tRNA (adenosine(37)-N6)-threonylcarbamoyltransferase complex dimerization subunit type 1 TsaB [Paraburkholderia kururiensis]